MATAQSSNSTPDRPAEALSLSETLKHTSHWQAYEAAASEDRRLNAPLIVGFDEEKYVAFRRAEDELDACKAEVFADWQSGKRKWFGCPGSSIAPHEEIPWSASEHLTFTWRNSTARERITGNPYFDIYTVPAEPMSPPEPQHDQVEAYSSDRWLAAEMKGTPPPSPDRRKHGWRTQYAQSLARKMRDDKNVKKPLVWRSILNRLRDFGL